MKDFWRNILQNDFNAQILAENDSALLLVGIRPAYYHMLISIENNLFQHHIPRYLMVSKFGTDFFMNWNQPDRPLHSEINSRLHAVSFSGKEYGFNTSAGYFKITGETGEIFFREIEEDRKRLKKAEKLVKNAGEYLYLDKIKTPAGADITHTDNHSLLVAVAFDYLLVKGKKKPHFGLYELYSNLVDKKYELTKRDFDSMTQHLMELLPSEMDESLVDSFEKVQNSFFESAIWGRHIDFGAGAARQAIEKAFKKLNESRKVMFKALYNLHGSLCLLLFAYILNEIDVYQYCYPVTMGYQPDSEEEQKIREEANMVELFKTLQEPLFK